jgi:ribosomal protein L22
MKRSMPAWRGTAHRIDKHTSKVSVILGTKEVKAKKAVKKAK